MRRAASEHARSRNAAFYVLQKFYSDRADSQK
jgi:hypothetical protein